MAGKLKLLKSKLKVWNISYGGNLKNKTILLNQINSFDVLQELRPLNEIELLERASLHMEFQDMAGKKERRDLMEVEVQNIMVEARR